MVIFKIYEFIIIINFHYLKYNLHVIIFINFHVIIIMLIYDIKNNYVLVQVNLQNLYSLV